MHTVKPELIKHTSGSFSIADLQSLIASSNLPRACNHNNHSHFSKRRNRKTCSFLRFCFYCMFAVVPTMHSASTNTNYYLEIFMIFKRFSIVRSELMKFLWLNKIQKMGSTLLLIYMVELDIVESKNYIK